MVPTARDMYGNLDADEVADDDLEDAPLGVRFQQRSGRKTKDIPWEGLEVHPGPPVTGSDLQPVKGREFFGPPRPAGPVSQPDLGANKETAPRDEVKADGAPSQANTTPAGGLSTPAPSPVRPSSATRRDGPYAGWWKTDGEERTNGTTPPVDLDSEWDGNKVEIGGPEWRPGTGDQRRILPKAWNWSGPIPESFLPPRDSGQKPRTALVSPRGAAMISFPERSQIPDSEIRAAPLKREELIDPQTGGPQVQEPEPFLEGNQKFKFAEWRGPSRREPEMPTNRRQAVVNGPLSTVNPPADVQRSSPGKPTAEPNLSGYGDTVNRVILTGVLDFDRAIEGLARFARLKAFADFLKERTARQEAALRGEAVDAGSGVPEQFVDPNGSGTSKVIGAVGGGLISAAPAIVTGGIPGLIAIGTQAMAEAAASAHDAAVDDGASDDEASRAAGIAALKTLPATIAFAGAGAVTSKALKGVLPLAVTPMTRAATTLGVNMAGNLAGSSVARLASGESPVPTVEDVVNSLVFATQRTWSDHRIAQERLTARAIVDGRHPEVVVLDGIAENRAGKFPSATAAEAAQATENLRAVAKTVLQEAARETKDIVRTGGGKAKAAPRGGANGNGNVREQGASRPKPKGPSLPNKAKRLKPNALYEDKGDKYRTDPAGRVTEAKFVLQLKKGKRSGYQQRMAGRGDGRRDTDQGGHLRAAQFDGALAKFNHVAMDAKLNSSDKAFGAWGKLESGWVKALKDVPPKVVEVEVICHYTDDTARPSSFTVTERIGNQTKIHVLNNQPGG